MLRRGCYGSCSFHSLEFVGFFPSSIRQAVKGWKMSFVGKKRKVWRVGPLSLLDCLEGKE